MNEKINMTVSGVVTKDGKKKVYVMFTDADKLAEGLVPDCKIISNKGFESDDIRMFEFYMRSNQNDIFHMAKKVNVMKAFMKK